MYAEGKKFDYIYFILFFVCSKINSIPVLGTATGQCQHLKSVIVFPIETAVIFFFLLIKTFNTTLVRFMFICIVYKNSVTT